MATKIVNCGFDPKRKNQTEPVKEVDCGYNPPRRGTTDGAGPERGTTQGSGPGPSAPITKHPRKS